MSELSVIGNTRACSTRWSYQYVDGEGLSIDPFKC